MDKVGLVLIGHGSKLPYHRETLEELVSILRKRSKFEKVESSFLTRNRPKIMEAIRDVAERGVEKIVLIPIFLSQGVHTKRDIPEILGLKEGESKLEMEETEIIIGEALGSDERIAEIIEEKALKALGQKNGGVNRSSDVSGISTGEDIFKTSMGIVRRSIADFLEGVPPIHTPVIERVVHSTADPEFARLLLIKDKAVETGVAAIKAGANVITDVTMVKAGINETRVKEFGGSLRTYISDERTIKLASQESITRSAAAMRLSIKDGMDGGIILIGNAPTAAFELAKAVKGGRAKPALIIATPVGFVGAEESKKAVSNLPIPSITVQGVKGGSTIAVAIFNALLSLAEGDKETPKLDEG